MSDATTHTAQEQTPMTEQATTRDRLILEVVRTRAEGAVQVSLSQVDENGVGMGYRLAGSKHYNMGVTTLLEEDLTERDATEIRKMLDAVFPVDPLPGVAELEASLAAKTAQHAETLGLLENAYRVIEEQRIAADTDLPSILSRETAASHGFPARPAAGDKHVAPNGLYVYALFGAGQWTLRVLAADLAAIAGPTQEGQADA